MKKCLLSDIKSRIKGSTLVRFTNCFLKMEDEIISDDLFVRGGVIQDSKKLFFEEKIRSDIVINCYGAIISPGFIDIQINGGFGCDFSDLSKDIDISLKCVGQRLVEYGVTSYCPTIVTSPRETYHYLLKKSFISSEGHAQIMGLHLEGPFISQEKGGMHNQSLIQADFGTDPIKTLVNMYGDDLSKVTYVTLAPELRGSLEVIRYLVDQGISVSLGHSVASFDDGVRAIENGANLLTHLFCSMIPFHHRDPHLIGLLTHESRDVESPTIFFGIITDLVHTHATALRIAHHSNRKGLIVVTDANPAFGLADGEYNFGSKEIVVTKGSSFVKGTGVLAGATCSLDQCMRNYWQKVRVTRSEALDSVTSHPAEALKVGHRKGRLRPGYDADLVILDYETMHVRSTWISGLVVYVQPGYSLGVTDS